MNFEFATVTRILFGSGTLSQVGPQAAAVGRRAFVVTGGHGERAASLLEQLTPAVWRPSGIPFR